MRFRHFSSSVNEPLSPAAPRTGFSYLVDAVAMLVYLACIWAAAILLDVPHPFLTGLMLAMASLALFGGRALPLKKEPAGQPR